MALPAQSLPTPRRFRALWVVNNLKTRMLLPKQVAGNFVGSPGSARLDDVVWPSELLGALGDGGDRENSGVLAPAAD